MYEERSEAYQDMMTQHEHVSSLTRQRLLALQEDESIAGKLRDMVDRGERITNTSKMAERRCRLDNRHYALAKDTYWEARDNWVTAVITEQTALFRRMVELLEEPGSVVAESEPEGPGRDQSNEIPDYTAAAGEMYDIIRDNFPCRYDALDAICRAADREEAALFSRGVVNAAFHADASSD